MTHQPHEAILRVLWPDGAKSRQSVWAVLDCARDPSLYRSLLESRLEFRCLYSGRLPRALEMVAPHLVELFPDHRLTARLLGEGWGSAWGIYIRIEDPSNLRHHLRKFLKVQDEQGRRLLFRYFDPRVLRRYLPTCTPAELKTVFGPIDAFVMEASDGEGLIEFRFDGLRLQQRPVAAAWASPS